MKRETSETADSNFINGADLIGPMAALAILAVAGLVLTRVWRRPPASRPLVTGRDPVTEASEESFPASDPPSWSPTRAGAPI